MEPSIRILHAGISVNDMEESLAWYEKNLGFRLVKDDGYVPPLEARICFVERDGFQMELFQYREPRPLPEERLTPNTDLQTVGTKHVAFSVENMAALKERFLANGADIAFETEMNGDHVMFVRDCSGVLLEFIETA